MVYFEWLLKNDWEETLLNGYFFFINLLCVLILYYFNWLRFIMIKFTVKNLRGLSTRKFHHMALVLKDLSLKGIRRSQTRTYLYTDLLHWRGSVCPWNDSLKLPDKCLKSVVYHFLAHIPLFARFLNNVRTCLVKTFYDVGVRCLF